MSASLALAAAGRAASGNEAGPDDEEDAWATGAVDGDFEPYFPGAAQLASESNLCTELVVLSGAGSALCVAAPVLEPDLGALIAVPVAFGSAVSGPRHGALV